MTKRAWIVLGVLLLPALFSEPARAQSLQEAKQAFVQGQESYDRGDFAGAIERWQRSFELSQKVSLFYNIGLAYERMGKLEDAQRSLERFVNGSQPDDLYLDRGRARLALIRERLGQTGVVLSCSEEGATILIDAHDTGRTPRPDRITLAPGNHQVIVRKAGFADFRSDVALSAGQELKLEVTLVPAATAPGEPLVASPEVASDETRGSSRSSLLGPVLTISGGAVAVAGIVVGAVALGKAKDAESEGDADSARTLALVADVSMAIGVAAAAVGAYLWLAVDSEPTPAAQALAITPRAGGAVVSTRVRF